MTQAKTLQATSEVRFNRFLALVYLVMAAGMAITAWVSSSGRWRSTWTLSTCSCCCCAPPGLGYSRFRVVISGKPTQRFFDARLLRIPTFDGRSLHQTQVTRHELEPTETFQVCLGQMSLETHRGELLRAFSFGGNLRATVDRDDLCCELTSKAPIFKLQDDPGSLNGVIADEILDLLAEKQATLAGHEDELYSRLARFDPYQIFLACMVSLQKRVDSIPANQRRERFRKLASRLKQAIQIVRDTDGWDGHSPSLEDLLSKGGA